MFEGEPAPCSTVRPHPPPSTLNEPQQVTLSSAGAALAAAAQADGGGGVVPGAAAGLLAVALRAVASHVPWFLAAPAQAAGTVPAVMPKLQTGGLWTMAREGGHV